LRKRGAARELEIEDARPAKTIVAVPATNERDNLPKALASLAECEGDLSETAIVVCVNHTAGASDEVVENNRESLRWLREASKGRGEIGERLAARGLRLALIDATSPGRELPRKHGGVGLARKIAIDSSLALFDERRADRNAILSLDADCVVSRNYLATLNALFDEGETEAAVVEYEHPLVGGEEERAAIVCYELYLRHYEIRLRMAGSPYAFHTVGSTMANTERAYYRVGGMNRRKAAEDFYYLEALAKVGDVASAREAIVYPSGRPSDRVPFGTGQRVRRHLSGERDEYRLYASESWGVIAAWIEAFERGAEKSGERLLAEAEEIHPILRDFLAERDFVESWNKVRSQSGTREQLLRQARAWMDAFKTLKLVHRLRDDAFPDAPMFDALDETFAAIGVAAPKRAETIPSLRIQAEYLRKARTALRDGTI
jgi:glycosyltransferase involved in cell wall biosynthesis